MTESTPLSPALTDRQLAKRWMKDLSTLRRWRAQGVGPKWVKVDSKDLPRGPGRQGSIRYPLADLLAYELTHGITPLN
jgi:hypothetical protein|tara:strand:+ start:9588 stop:9821 length:234 start_codon:yes stop_codon:yes gene_type:complete